MSTPNVISSGVPRVMSDYRIIFGIMKDGSILMFQKLPYSDMIVCSQVNSCSKHGSPRQSHGKEIVYP